MKKISKLISFFAALCMIISMFSGLTVFAEEATETTTALTVADWDADNDFITLDFDEEVNISADNVTLMKGDKNIAVTVHHSKHDAIEAQRNAKTPTTTGIDPETRYTYLITPVASKLELGEIYKLTVNNVTAVADTTKILSNWEQRFRVNKIDDVMTLGTSTSSDVWTYGQNSGNVTVSQNSDGSIKMNFAATSSTTEGAYLQKQPMNKNLKDYTVKIKFVNIPVGPTVNAALVALKSSVEGYKYTNNSSPCVFMEAQMQSDVVDGSTGEISGGTKRVQAAIRTASENSATKTYSNFVNPWRNTKLSDGVEFKVSTKGAYARMYVDGVKFADISKNNVDLAGVPSFRFGIASGHGVGYSADATGYLVTQVEAIDAESVIDLAGWDADTDFITLDFAQEMNLTELNEAITLTKNGVDMPVTAILNKNAYVKDVNTQLTKNSKHVITEKYTYTLTPEEGSLEPDAVYSLKVGSVSTADGAKTFAGMEKLFKVTVLDSGMGGYAYDSTTPNTWKYMGGSSDSGLQVTTSEDDKLTFKWSTSSATHSLFAKKGDNASVDTTPENYTVELTFKADTNTTKNHYFRLYTSLNGVDTDSDTVQLYTQFALGSTSNDVYKDGNRMIYIQHGSGDSQTTYGDSTFDCRQWDNLLFGQEMNLKLSVKDGTIRGYINNEKVADMTATTGTGNPGFSCGAGKADGATTANVEVYGYKMTKAVEITGFEVGNTVVTDSTGAEITAKPDDGKINVSTAIVNGTAAAEEIYVVCALYADNNEMLDCYVEEAKSVPAGELIVSSFNDINMGTATKAKVFIWDNINSLIPYRTNLVFPASAE